MDLERVEEATQALRMLAEGMRRAGVQWPEPVAEVVQAFRPVSRDEATAFARRLAADHRWRAFAQAVNKAALLVQGVSKAANTREKP